MDLLLDSHPYDAKQNVKLRVQEVLSFEHQMYIRLMWRKHQLAQRSDTSVATTTKQDV